MSATKHLYKDQPVTVSLDTKTTLTGATTQIKYTKPDGTVGYKTATVSTTSVQAGFTGAELNAAGRWQFRAWITFSGDALPTPGVPVYHNVEAVV
jgi:hypothetical protein